MLSAYKEVSQKIYYKHKDSVNTISSMHLSVLRIDC